MRDLIRRSAQIFGYDVVRSRRSVSSARELPTSTSHFEALAAAALPFTMTSIPRLLAVYSAAQYVVRQEIPGAVVECGVWRGGSMMMAAGALLELRATDRDLYLFDTFQGMTPPTAMDLDRSGTKAEVLLRQEDRESSNSVWCVADLEEVKRNMSGTGYPPERTRYVRGPVELTLPAEAPEEISLLRLDTDWYESTLHELTHLFPRISQGGVLIIDDYGHWRGARKAVDEFLEAQDRAPMLIPLDDTGVCAVVA